MALEKLDSKTTFKFGIFVETLCCTKCDWFNKSMLNHRSVCPACGEKVKYFTGRYLIKETIGFFGRKNIECVNFIKGKKC